MITEYDASTHVSIHAHYIIACMVPKLSQIASDCRDKGIYGISHMSGHITGPVMGPEAQRRVRRPPTGAEGPKQPSSGARKRGAWTS